MRIDLLRLVLVASAAALAACSDAPRPEPRDRPPVFHPAIEILERYDANHDGVLTRAELEAGLKADFSAADTNHDGRLDEEETRAVNQQRWSENASTTSTLVDWNHDGFVDFNEFAATARSLFDQLDADGDGRLSPKEWKPIKPATKADGQNPPSGEAPPHS